MYCYQCGKEVGDVKFCPYCGAQLDGQTAQGTYQPINNQQTQYSQPGDEPSFGYALLSFFIPIVGIILFVVWNQEFPLRAKSCLKGFVTGLITGVVGVCCIFAALGNTYSSYQDIYYDYDYDMFTNAVVEVVSYE